MLSFFLWIVKYLYFNYFKKNNVNFKTKVITYHNLSSFHSFNDYTVSLKSFENQVKLIRSMGFDIISFDKVCNLTNEKFIVFTFDDGFKGIVKAALVLKKYGYSATFFITTSLVGEQGYVDWVDLQELKELGFQIASHSHNHHMMSELAYEDCQFEMMKSKKLLESKLNCSVDLFAFPYGQRNSFTEENFDNLRACGYKKCFTQIPADQRHNFLTENFSIGRSGVKSFYNLKKFKTLI